MRELPRRTRYDAVVIGAGLIGLACAWRARRRGLRVLVVDRAREPGAGASAVAAGMLAPVTEADFGDEARIALNLAARERWPSFAAELEEITGLPTGYRDCGALVVAADRDDVAELRRLHDFQRALGLAVEWLPPSRSRAVEPGLAPRIGGAILASGDGVADPVQTVAALAAAAGEIELGADVAAIDHDGARVTGVRTSAGPIACERVVIAAGAWSAALAPEGSGPPVRPVKGQLLRLRDPHGPGLVGRTIRTTDAYLVPRADGRYALGATMEERGFDTAPTAGAVFELLRDISEVVPGVLELEIEELLAGLRPATPDNVPAIGPGALEGLVWAAGHHRNGILLSGLTGELAAAALCGDELPDWAAPADPSRFAGVPA